MTLEINYILKLNDILRCPIVMNLLEHSKWSKTQTYRTKPANKTETPEVRIIAIKWGRQWKERWLPVKDEYWSKLTKVNYKTLIWLIYSESSRREMVNIRAKFSTNKCHRASGSVHGIYITSVENQTSIAIIFGSVKSNVTPNLCCFYLPLNWWTL